MDDHSHSCALSVAHTPSGGRIMHTRTTVARLPRLLAVALFAAGCRDAVGPERHAPSGPQFATEATAQSEEHTSELQSLAYLVCRLLLEKKKNIRYVT